MWVWFHNVMVNADFILGLLLGWVAAIIYRTLRRS